MTCIVALIQDGTPYFAADTLVVQTPSPFHSGVGQTVRNEPKIWAREGMLFGANGHVRMLQLIRYKMEIPAYTPGQNKIAYLVQQFIPAMQRCFVQEKYGDDELGGNLLLALEGELFTIGDGFNVCNTSNTYESVGKAHEVALGSLHSTAHEAPLTRLYKALAAAEHHTCVVSSPYHYITNKMDEAAPLTEDFLF